MGNENDIVCVRVADFDYNNLSISGRNLTLRNFPRVKKHLLLNKRSVLVEKSGGGEKQLVGRVVSFTLNKDAICSNFIEKLTILDNCHARYAVYLFAALYAAKVNGKAIKQTIGIQNLDLHYYFQTFVPFPPLETQKQIVAKLSAAQEYKKRLLEQKLKLKGLFDSVLHKSMNFQRTPK